MIRGAEAARCCLYHARRRAGVDILAHVAMLTSLGCGPSDYVVPPFALCSMCVNSASGWKGFSITYLVAVLLKLGLHLPQRVAAPSR